MAIRLIGFDLDGTLLTSDHRITSFTLSVLREAAGRGVQIVPVTGRPLGAVPGVLLEMPEIRYLISSNGAVITDRKSEKAPAEHLIPAEEALEILKLIREKGAQCEIIYDGWGYNERQALDLQIAMAGDNGPRINYLKTTRKVIPSAEDFLRTLEKGVENLVPFGMDRETGRALRGELEQSGRHVVSYGDVVLEIGTIESDKGRALRTLAELLDVAPEEIMSIGDSSNDSELLRAAGLGVAMGNASEMLKEMADAVTERNDEDGAAKAIQKYCLKQS